MTNSNGDRLDQFIQFVTQYTIRTEALLQQHEQRFEEHRERLEEHRERIQRLEEIQSGILQILERLSGGSNDRQ